MSNVEKLEQFMEQNWMIGSDVIEALILYSQKHGKDFEVSLSAGRLYATPSFQAKIQEHMEAV